MPDLPHPASTPTPDPARDLEIRVLTDIINAIESLLRHFEDSGTALVAPRPEAYALVIHAVLASARATGHHGSGSLAYAPLLDAIPPGVETNPWEAATFTTLIHGIARP